MYADLKKENSHPLWPSLERIPSLCTIHHNDLQRVPSFGVQLETCHKPLADNMLAASVTALHGVNNKVNCTGTYVLVDCSYLVTVRIYTTDRACISGRAECAGASQSPTAANMITQFDTIPLTR